MRDWERYQEETYNNNVQKLLVEFLNYYKVSSAIDLGCGSGNETVYMLKKGINVVAIDKFLNRNNILSRINFDERKCVSFIESSFENVLLPNVDLVVAFFSIPFCNPKYFDFLWKKIYDAINDNGYFVGQLFGDRDDWDSDESICTFSYEEVKEYLKFYKIIKFDEVYYVREKDGKKWHFFDIIVQKVSGD